MFVPAMISTLQYQKINTSSSVAVKDIQEASLTRSFLGIVEVLVQATNINITLLQHEPTGNHCSDH